MKYKIYCETCKKRTYHNLCDLDYLNCSKCGFSNGEILEEE